MSERPEEILQRFKDDWNALERELRNLIDELKRGDRNEFPDLDAKVQVPFVRLVLEECGKGRELSEAQRSTAITATLDIVERTRQEIRKVSFWKNEDLRELLPHRDPSLPGVPRPYSNSPSRPDRKASRVGSRHCGSGLVRDPEVVAATRDRAPYKHAVSLSQS